MTSPLVEWAALVLRKEGVSGWRVVVQGVVDGAGCCNYRTREIVLPRDAGPGLVLHELAHVGCEPGHGLDWQRRLMDLTDRHTVEVWTMGGEA